MSYGFLLLFICAAFSFCSAQSKNGREECQKSCSAQETCYTNVYIEKNDSCSLIFRYNQTLIDKNVLVSMVHSHEGCETLCQALPYCLDVAFYAPDTCELFSESNHFNKRQILEDPFGTSIEARHTLPFVSTTNETVDWNPYIYRHTPTARLCLQLCKAFTYCMDINFVDHYYNCQMVLEPIKIRKDEVVGLQDRFEGKIIPK